MNDNEADAANRRLEIWVNMLAFCSIVAAIVILALVGAWLIKDGKTVEGLGIGAAVTGLIGVLGTFKPKTPTQDSVRVNNTPANPLPTTDTAAPSTDTEPASADIVNRLRAGAIAAGRPLNEDTLRNIGSLLDMG